jgi:hypothetical protein
VKKILFSALSVGSLMSAGVFIAAPASAAETPIAQVCAATSISQVDAILNQVADSALLRSLDDIVGIDVSPDASSVEIDSSVQLSDIKRTLNCASTTPSTDPSADPDPSDDPDPSTAAPRPFPNCKAVRRAGLDPISSSNARFQKGLDLDGDGIGCELNGDDDQVKKIPNDPPETGEGPADDQPAWLLGGFGFIAAAGFAGRKVLSGQA